MNAISGNTLVEPQTTDEQHFWSLFKPSILPSTVADRQKVEDIKLEDARYHLGAIFNIESGITVIAVPVCGLQGLQKFYKTSTSDDSKYLMAAGFKKSTISAPAVELVR